MTAEDGRRGVDRSHGIEREGELITTLPLPIALQARLDEISLQTDSLVVEALNLGTYVLGGQLFTKTDQGKPRLVLFEEELRVSGDMEPLQRLPYHERPIPLFVRIPKDTSDELGSRGMDSNAFLLQALDLRARIGEGEKHYGIVDGRSGQIAFQKPTPYNTDGVFIDSDSTVSLMQAAGQAQLYAGIDIQLALEYARQQAAEMEEMLQTIVTRTGIFHTSGATDTLSENPYVTASRAFIDLQKRAALAMSDLAQTRFRKTKRAQAALVYKAVLAQHVISELNALTQMDGVRFFREHDPRFKIRYEKALGCASDSMGGVLRVTFGTGAINLLQLFSHEQLRDHLATFRMFCRLFIGLDDDGLIKHDESGEVLSQAPPEPASGVMEYWRLCFAEAGAVARAIIRLDPHRAVSVDMPQIVREMPVEFRKGKYGRQVEAIVLKRLEMQRDLRDNVLFNPRSGYFLGLVDQFRELYRRNQAKYFLEIIGLNETETLISAYRRARMLATEGEHTSFFNAFATSVAEYLNSSTTEISFMGFDDALATYTDLTDIDVLPIVECDAEYCQRLRTKLNRLNTYKAKFRDGFSTAITDVLAWYGMVPPDNIKLEFNSTRPDLISFTFVYDDGGERNNLRLVFNLKQGVFDWNIFEDPTDESARVLSSACLKTAEGVIDALITYAHRETERSRTQARISFVESRPRQRHMRRSSGKKAGGAPPPTLPSSLLAELVEGDIVRYTSESQAVARRIITTNFEEVLDTWHIPEAARGLIIARLMRFNDQRGYVHPKSCKQHKYQDVGFDTTHVHYRCGNYRVELAPIKEEDGTLLLEIIRIYNRRDKDR